MFRSVTTTLLLTMLVMMPAQVFAETIVVTGTRIPMDVEDFGGAVTVITARDIELHQYRDITDALASVPGLHVAPSGGVGAQTSVFMRGAESNHVLVLIDGVEVVNPGSGLFSLEHFQLNDVERIEVLRGPYSAQYGSEAIGGVINVVTRRGTGTPAAKARIESGSFETHSAIVNFSGQYGRSDFSLGSAWLQTAGQSFTPQRLRGGSAAERDGYDNLDIKASLGFDIDAASRIDLGFGYVAADTRFDGFGHPFEVGALESSLYERRYSLNWSGEYLRSSWQPSLQGSHYSGQFHSTGGTRMHAARSKVEWRNDFSLSRSMKLVAGVETELEKVSGERRDSARTRAFYLQAWFQPFERLSLSGGWRNDDPDDFGTASNWQLSASYALSEFGADLYASYGTAFKAPTLGDRFGFGGNADLDPERSHSWEVGGRQNLSASRGQFNVGWGVNYFDNEIRDLIAFDLVDFQLKNIRSARIEGLESFISLDTAAGFGLRIDGTVMRAYDGERVRLPRRPLRKGTLEMRWLGSPKWKFSTQINYVGRQSDIRRDTFRRVDKGGYTLVDVTAGYELSKDFSLFLRADNLFDRDYEPVDGYAGRGIGVHAGVEFDL